MPIEHLHCIQTRSRVQVKINSKTAIVSHQFCSPRLVFPVGGMARGGGGGVGGGRGVNKVLGFLNDEKTKALKSFFTSFRENGFDKEVVKFLLVSSPICQLRPKTRDGDDKCNYTTS